MVPPDGIEIEADRIATVEDWPTPTSVKDVQVVTRFTNFYRRFVRKFAKVTAPIIDLLKNRNQVRAWARPGA